MNIILSFIYALYLIIGIGLTIYWWKCKYSKEYKEALQKDELERPMISLFLIVFTIFWPLIILISKLNNKK